MNRHQLFGAAATVAVLAGLLLGFLSLGGPGRQRELSADQQRAGDLVRISTAISQLYATDKKLPADLNAVLAYNPGLRPRDPETNAAYEYKPIGDTQYQLCATFAQVGSPASADRFQRSMFSFHSAGRQCFNLDAVRTNLSR